MSTELQRCEPEAVTAAIDELANIVEPDRPGWTRRALTDEALAGRDQVARQMKAAGLQVRIDGAGNVVGLLEGRSGGRALVTGSHTDTVQGGGRFDGIVGVVGAIEAVRLLQQSDVQLDHDLLLVDFYGEEANDFGLSCLGSRALTGNLGLDHLARSDADGRTLGDTMRSSGVDPDSALASRWAASDVEAFIELHIEQGPVLELAGASIGVVSAIAAIARAELTFHGRRDHAGTMPVDLRHDAAAAAAEALLTVEKLGRDGGIALAGQLVIEPGAANVVPDLARLTAEFRSTDVDWMHRRREMFDEAAQAAAARRGVSVETEWISGEPRVQMTDAVASLIDTAASQAGYRAVTLPSGAGHDTVQMASITDVGMIFVPSRDGRSHCPEEFTEATDLARGIDVLARTLVNLDRRQGTAGHGRHTTSSDPERSSR